MSQRCARAAPTNAAFFSLFLEDALLLSFVASHIPRFFVAKSCGADLIMKTLMWVQITDLPLYDALLTGNMPACADANGAASPLPPAPAGLKRKSKTVLGKIFLLSTRFFTLTFAGLGGRNHDVRVRARNIW